MFDTVTITAAGRALSIRGTVPLYLKTFHGWNADVGMTYASAKDIPTGSTVIDVGANIGIICCSLAVQRPDLSIVAIEPVPDNVECLRQNVAANQLTNVEVVAAAASDTPGVVRMNSNGPWSAVQEHGDVVVPAAALDQFIDRNVAFVKIDVEGWEPYVLAGARALLAARRPLVLMELNSWSLMLAHHDPIAFSRTVWKAFDVTETFHQDKPQGPPQNELDVVHRNVTAHGSVTDILMRPKADVPLPSLEGMISSPAHLRLLHARASAAF